MDRQTRRDLAAAAIVEEWLGIPGAIPPEMDERIAYLKNQPAKVDLPRFLPKRTNWGR